MTLEDEMEMWAAIQGQETRSQQCPYCDSKDATELGPLGFIIWYRCRQCGMEYSERTQRAQTD